MTSILNNADYEIETLAITRGKTESSRLKSGQRPAKNTCVGSVQNHESFANYIVNATMSGLLRVKDKESGDTEAKSRKNSLKV